MVMEVCCGQCNGRLLVDTPGIIVACPYCGVHLSVPLPDDDPNGPSSDVGANPQATATVSESGISTQQTIGDGIIADSASANPVVAVAPNSEPTERASDLSVSAEPVEPQTSLSSQITEVASTPPAAVEQTVVAEVSSHDSTPDFSWMNVAEATTTAPTWSLEQPVASTTNQIALQPAADAASSPINLLEVVVPSPAVSSDAPAAAVAVPSEAVNPFSSAFPSVEHSKATGSIEAPESGSQPSFVFDKPHTMPEPAFELSNLAASSPETIDSFVRSSQIVGVPAASHSQRRSSEAIEAKQAKLALAILIIGSYASLLTIYFVYLFLFDQRNKLESLPDLKTVKQSGGRAIVPRPENDLPPGHQLKLGQSERFGNIRVTPLRVTRGPIAFTHYSGANAASRAPSDPVLKLWLKFENLSERQSIVPLDTTLMFFQGMADNHIASYNVIFREDDRKQHGGQFHYLFDRMAADSEWMMVGQHTNEELSPGQSFDTFVPSEENTEGLTGNVIWRVHFRKGYGPKSGNGVTTLIDVRFNSDDIRSDSV